VLVLGLRKGEVLGMCWYDLDPDDGNIVVGLQLQRVGRRRLLHRETKTDTGDDAQLPLPDIYTTALRLRHDRGTDEEDPEH
jgi:integrase